MRAVYFCLILVFAISGCSTTSRHIQWYDGEPLSSNKIALLKIQPDYVGVFLLVDRINGEPLDKGVKTTGNNTREIELLPGKYDLSVSYYNANNKQRSISDALISFDAHAGTTYEMRAAPEEMSFGKELKLDAFGGHSTWTLWIIDAGTGEVVAGMPRKTPRRWYE